MNLANVAAASNGRAAVAVFRTPSGEVWPLRYAPSRIGLPEHANEFRKLFARAAVKLAQKG